MSQAAAESSETSDRILERLLALHPKRIDLSLGRVERLLDRLGRPQDALPPVVHVAGTNGKGSVIAYMRAALQAAGQRCHVYTSPHLVRFAERIRLADAPIAEPDLAALLAECERANAGAPITFFEITTAAAFLAFARAPADVLLLEVGLGGRLDATNVVAKPVLTAITPISLDHKEFLGASLAGIAQEKAAIQKPGVDSVIGPQPTAAAAEIAGYAAAVGARPFRHGADWRFAADADGLSWQGPDRSWRLPPPNLAGPHQWENAAIAVAALDRLDRNGLAVPEAAIAAGLQGADWPARLQALRRGPLAVRLPDGWSLWLDGGHNAGAGAALAAWAGEPDPQANPRGNPGPLLLIVGMLNSKEADGFLAPLAPHVAGLRAVTIPGVQAALPADALCRAAADVGIAAAAPAAGVADALDDLIAGHTGPARVLICGSLYLAGAVLRDEA